MKLVLNTIEVERTIATLRGKSPAAFVRSLNRGIAAGRTLLVRNVRREMRLKSRQVRDRTTVTNATFDRPSATITASPKPVPAIEFSARGPEPSRGRGRGVVTRLPSGRLPHAFITTVGTGRHRGVFQRVGRARLPIREVKGPSVWFVASKAQHLDPVADRVLEQAAKTLEHEIGRLLRRA